MHLCYKSPQRHKLPDPALDAASMPAGARARSCSASPVTYVGVNAAGGEQCTCLLQRALRAVVQRQPRHERLARGRRQAQRLARLVLQLKLVLRVAGRAPGSAQNNDACMSAAGRPDTAWPPGKGML